MEESLSILELLLLLLLLPGDIAISSQSVVCVLLLDSGIPWEYHGNSFRLVECVKASRRSLNGERIEEEGGRQLGNKGEKGGPSGGSNDAIDGKFGPDSAWLSWSRKSIFFARIL